MAALAVFVALLLLARRRDDALPWLLVGLNPRVVVGVVNGGHNDALVALALLAAVLLAVARRPLFAAIALALGALVKIVVLLPIVALVAWTWRRHGVRTALVTVGMTATLIAGAYAVAGGTVALDPLRDAQHDVTRSAIWNAPRRDMTFELVEEGLRGRVAGKRASNTVVRWANITVVGLALLLVAPRLRDRTPALAVGGATLAYLLAGAYVVPWYTVWALPALALVRRSWVTALTLVAAAAITLAYVPDATPVHLDSVVTPWQSLRYDIFSVWVPMTIGALVVAAVLLSCRTVWRTRGQTGAGPANSATTPKWSLADVPVSERSQTTRADSTRPEPSSRRQPTKM
jgi:alpha-1,6-mannosyltransferase